LRRGGMRCARQSPCCRRPNRLPRPAASSMTSLGRRTRFAGFP
jgi:hypothetical protein